MSIIMSEDAIVLDGNRLTNFFKDLKAKCFLPFLTCENVLYERVKNRENP